VLDLKKADVQKVRYEDATRWAEILRPESGDGFTWVRYGFRPRPASQEAADAGVADAQPDGGQVDGGTDTRPDAGVRPDAGGAAALAKHTPPVPEVPEREVRGNPLSVT